MYLYVTIQHTTPHRTHRLPRRKNLCLSTRKFKLTGPSHHTTPYSVILPGRRAARTIPPMQSVPQHQRFQHSTQTAKHHAQSDENVLSCSLVLSHSNLLAGARQVISTSTSTVVARRHNQAHRSRRRVTSLAVSAGRMPSLS